MASQSLSQSVAVSGSTLTKVKVVRVSHTWTIENFTFCGLANGGHLSSRVFSANNSELTPKWRLKLYPKGDLEDDKEFISLFLSKVSPAKMTHKVTVSFSIINSDGAKTNTINMEEEFNVGESWGWDRFVERDSVIKCASVYLPDGNLTIKCDIAYAVDTVIMPMEEGVKVPQVGELQLDFTSLLESGTLADVTLQVEGTQLPAHKTVLAARSPVFRAMFNYDVREKSEQTVHIVDLKADVVREMLTYIYTDTSPNASKMAADLLIAADKYDLGRLRLICEDVLSRDLKVNNVVEVLQLADEYNADHLKQRCVEFFHTHAEEIVQLPMWKIVKRSHPAFQLLHSYIASSDEKSATPPKKKCRYQ